MCGIIHIPTNRISWNIEGNIRRSLMDPEKIIDNLMKELDVAIKAMSKAKTVERKSSA